MTEFKRNPAKPHHVVVDAFGRRIDLGTHADPWQAQACACHRDRLPISEGTERARTSAAAVTIAAVVAGGLVLTMLLVVIRDIALAAIASSGVAGLVVRWLLAWALRQGE